MKAGLKLELSLFGPLNCQWSNGERVNIRGGKQRALVAMLAMAPNGVHSRGWIQEHLWGRSGEELGRQSLRRMLSDMRKEFGCDFDKVFEANNSEIKLNLNIIKQVSTAKDGEFLEGIKVQETKFLDWLERQRQQSAPSPIYLDSDTRLAISPTVAILPFTSINSLTTESHFGDLVAMDVARSLSRSKLIDVISHLSSRKLAGRLLDLVEVQAKLNADYAIGGNVRLSEDRFRLDVDFIQTKTGRILWTESFDGNVRDLLNGNSPLIERVAQQCGREVVRASVEIAASDPLPEVASHALFMASIKGMHQHHLASFARARDNLEELIKRAPRHSKIHAWLGKWYILAISQGWSNDAQKDIQLAADCTARGLDLNPNCSTTLTIDGMVQGDRSDDMSVAISRFQSAMDVDPNQGLAWLMYSRMNSFLGNGRIALDFARKARRLSPLDPHGYFYDIMEAMACKVTGDFEGAIKLARRSLDANPRHISSYRLLTMSLQMAGQDEEAQRTGKILRKLEPNLTIDRYLKNHPAGRLDTGREWAHALQQAGIPLN